MSVGFFYVSILVGCWETPDVKMSTQRFFLHFYGFVQENLGVLAERVGILSGQIVHLTATCTALFHIGMALKILL